MTEGGGGCWEGYSKKEQYKYWHEEEKKSEALIPLLFQLRSVRSQEALDKSSVVGLSVYNYSTIS